MPNRPIPPGLSRLAALSWRFIVIAGAVSVVVLAIFKFRLIVVPLVFGAMIATVLGPATGWLVSHRVPRVAATLVVMVVVLLVIVAVLGGIVPATLMEYDALRTQADDGVASLNRWLVEGPLKLDQEVADRYAAQLLAKVTTNLSSAVGSVLSQAALGSEILAGVALTIPIVFFILKDGEKIRDWGLGWVGEENLPRVSATWTRVWSRFGAFVRGLVLVALFDAVCIGIGLLLIGVPLVLPLAVIVFIGAFIPVIGGVVAGFFAVAVATVTGGIIDGALTLGLIIIVQQLDSMVVGPLVLSRAGNIHPLVVLFSLAVGSILGGVVGAFLAVPFAVVCAVIVQELRHPTIDSPAPSVFRQVRRKFGLVRPSAENEPPPDAPTS